MLSEEVLLVFLSLKSDLTVELALFSFGRHPAADEWSNYTKRLQIITNLVNELLTDVQNTSLSITLGEISKSIEINYI